MDHQNPAAISAHQREQALFAAALDRPVDERAAFLAGACHGDPALRQRLEALLAAHEQPATELALPAAEAAATAKATAVTESPDEAVGQTLGRYKLLERVGEGGCGVVYVAEQTEPVRRRVALKVIKLGMDTKQVVARFEAERQALAMMDHPNIAKVLDAGTTNAGRPYCVMELVRGIRITDYCDQAHLSTPQRLDLFIKVCSAIQHAHQKGIIHRDIKPSNILVTLHDGVPVPKVIDFGIAKATEGRLTDATVYTELHAFVGTPAYMSPEQAEMSGLDIDTRADIYSLGVLLYELLTGKPPFDAKELMSQGLDAMRRTIREVEPARPSTRLGTLAGDDLTTLANRRSVGAHQLQHQLKGDLDWIVMKALEKDRTRRYETANGFAADLTRHLSNEPVIARPPTAAYRFQKAYRRNNLAFAAGAAIDYAIKLRPDAFRELPDEDLAAIGKLRTHPKLRQIQAEIEGTMYYSATQPKDNFWQDWDRLQTFLPALRKTGFRFSLSKLPDGTYFLTIANQPLSDLSIVKGAPISKLNVYGCKITDLTPLRDLPLKFLNLDGNPITDLSPLRGVTLDNLRLRDTPVSDLSPLAGMPLRALHLENCRKLTDIAPLLAVPTLEELTVPMRARNLELLRKLPNLKMLGFNYVEGTPVTIGSTAADFWKEWDSSAWRRALTAADIPYSATEITEETPKGAGAGAYAKAQKGETGKWKVTIQSKDFSDCSLLQGGDNIVELILTGSAVADLKPLRGMPLKTLALGGTKVADLEPLRGMPLKALWIYNTKVTDLSPLKGMPLTDLHLGEYTGELSVLKGMPLQSLKLHACDARTDFSPLAGAKELTALTLPAGVSNIDFLRALPKLERIGFKEDWKNHGRPTRRPRSFGKTTTPRAGCGRCAPRASQSRAPSNWRTAPGLWISADQLSTISRFCVVRRSPCFISGQPTL